MKLSTLTIKTPNPMQKIDLKKESWCVKNDGSLRFAETVMKWLNDGYEDDDKLVGDVVNMYYGFKGYRDVSFKPFGHVLTIPEFEQLTKQPSSPPSGEKTALSQAVDYVKSFMKTTERTEYEAGVQRTLALILDKIEELLQTEKQQIKNAWEEGSNMTTTINTAEQYYSQTYNS